MKSLPMLYKMTGAGATQTWQVFYTETGTFTKFGPKGGTIQTSAEEKVTAKNVGKKNEIGVAEQAKLAAEQKWRAKLGSGYVKKLSQAVEGAADASVSGGTWPMLAKKFVDSGSKIAFPAFAQPKLDGHRCIAVVGPRNDVSLWSRKRKPIANMPHVVSAIQALKLCECVLDGELYAHAKKDRFEDLTKMIKHGDPRVEYHVFDLVGPQDFSIRTRWLELAFEHAKSPLVLVETAPVAGEAELQECFERFLASGYEGAMVRNAAGPYEGHPTHRSNNLQKMKTFIDDEFVVLSVKEGKGKLEGHAIFMVATKNGSETEVKLQGPTSELKKYWEDPSLAVGRKLTVKFQGYFETGKLRFPTALRFREDL